MVLIVYVEKMVNWNREYTKISILIKLVIYLSVNNSNTDWSYSEEIQNAISSIYKEILVKVLISIAFVFFFVFGTTLIAAEIPEPGTPDEPLKIVEAIDRVHSNYSLRPDDAFTVLAILAAIVVALSLTSSSEVTGRANFGKAVANYELKKLILNLCGFMSSIVMAFVILFWMSTDDIFRSGIVNSVLAIFMALVVLILTVVRVRREDLEIASLTRSIERAKYDLEKLTEIWKLRWQDSILNQDEPVTSLVKKAIFGLLKSMFITLIVWLLNVFAFIVALLVYGYQSDLLMHIEQALSPITVVVVSVFFLPLLALAIISVCVRNFRRNIEFIPVHVFVMLISLVAILSPFLFIYNALTSASFFLPNHLNAFISFIALVYISPALFTSRKNSWKRWARPLKIIQDAQWSVAELLELERRKTLNKWITSMSNEIPQKANPPTPRELSNTVAPYNLSCAAGNGKQSNNFQPKASRFSDFAKVAAMGTVAVTVIAWAKIKTRNNNNN